MLRYEDVSFAPDGGCCCQRMAANLGQPDSPEAPAYISPTVWQFCEQRKATASSYPGATGPGWYTIANLGHDYQKDLPMIEFQPLAACPYCGAALQEPSV